MAVAEFSFWSLRTLKARLGTSLATKDDLLEQLANAVSRLFEKETGRVFVIREFVEHRDGSGRNDLWLRNYPVTALTSITVERYLGQTTPEAITLGPGYSRLVADRGLVLLANDVFTRGMGNVVATYEAGYFAQDAGADSAAADVYNAALDLVELLFKEISTGAMATASLTMGPNGFVVKNDWPKHILSAFRDWKRVRL